MLAMTFLVFLEARSQCDARFTFTIDTVKNDVFLISSPDSTVKRFWYLNNQLVSNDDNPVVSLPFRGPYTIVQIVEGNQCIDSFEQRIIIDKDAQCYADFQVSIDRDSAFFQFKGIGPRVLWEFGDGNFSVNFNPVHGYNLNPGTTDSFVVRLTASANQIRCSDTVEQLIVVSKPATCLADFDFKLLGDSVEFTAKDTTATNYFWDFGDGSTGAGQNTTHTFKSNGDFTVQLVVVDSLSNCSDSVSRKVSILPQCRAKFKLAVDTTISYKLFLINESTEMVGDRYLWDFGDGNTSTERNPIHVFQQFGKFKICLSISNDTFNCASSYCLETGMDETGRLLKNGAFELWVIEDEVLTVELLHQQRMQVYPNPFSDRLIVESDQPIIEMEIRNLQGVPVYHSRDMNSEESVITTQELPPGMYWVLVRTKGYRRVIKVLKQ